jgi:hypothetical protein
MSNTRGCISLDLQLADSLYARLIIKKIKFSSYMTLQLIHSELPYIRGKFYFISAETNFYDESLHDLVQPGVV